MAIWRSPGLETLLGGQLNAAGITSGALERLATENTPESEQLEFKRSLYGSARGPRPGWTDDQEFAKDVTAFANHRGGLLVVGIDDPGRVAAATVPLAATIKPELEERRLRQALVNYQAPVAGCEFVWVPASPSGWFLAVVVPPSRRSPHAVLGDRSDPRPTLRYPVRHGPDTAWLSEAEVAERYRRRLNAQQDEHVRIERVVKEGCQALRQAAGVWLYLAIVPENPTFGRLDFEVVRDIEDWHREGSLPSPLNRALPAYGRGIPAPGRVTFTGSLSAARQDETEVRDAYLELHVDGSAFGATPICARSTGDASSRELGDVTLIDDTIVVTDVITRWCASQAGAWGTATVVIGLVDSASEDLTVSEPVQLVHSDYGEARRRPGTRRVTGMPSATCVADLAAVDTVQKRLIVAYHASAGLLQWFGVPEPTQLRRDGTIVPVQFLKARHRQVEQWARDFGVRAETPASQR